MELWSKNEQLCILARQGDKEAIGQLYQNNIRFINRCCYGIARNKFEYEELQQSAFFILRDCVFKYNPDLGFKFISYFGIALSHRLLYYISKSRYPNELLILDAATSDSENNLIDFIPDETAVDPQAQLEITHLQEIVQIEFNKLSGDTKNILDLHFLKGYTFEQIGQMLGISIHQVRAILIHGRNMLSKNQNLRKLYQSWFNVDESELLRKKYQKENK